MALVSLATLRTRAQELADMDQSGAGASSFAATATWNRWLNLGLRRVYGRMVTAFEDYYVKTSTAFTATVANQELYSLDSDFMKLDSLRLQLSNGKWKTLTPYTKREAGAYRNQTLAVPPEYESRYRLMGTPPQISILPVPTVALSVHMDYVPQFSDLVNDTDTFEGVNGFEEIACLDAAIRALTKEESDASALQALRAQEMERLDNEAAQRDEANPPVVSDVYRDDWEWL